MGYQNLHRPITNKHWQQVASIIKNVCAPENKELWVNQAPMLFACEDAEPTYYCSDKSDSCRLQKIFAYPIIDLRNSSPSHLDAIRQNHLTKHDFNGIMIPSCNVQKSLPIDIMSIEWTPPTNGVKGMPSYNAVFHFNDEWWGIADSVYCWKYYRIILHNILIEDYEPPQGVEELLPDLMRIQLDVLRRGE